eukprot:8875777-Alexandrium_andersonii.AAC.1
MAWRGLQWNAVQCDDIVQHHAIVAQCHVTQCAPNMLRSVLCCVCATSDFTTLDGTSRVLCYAVPCRAVPCRAVPCRS